LAHGAIGIRTRRESREQERGGFIDGGQGAGSMVPVHGAPRLLIRSAIDAPRVLAVGENGTDLLPSFHFDHDLVIDPAPDGRKGHNLAILALLLAARGAGHSIT
jgi:hypothetical protein